MFWQDGCGEEKREQKSGKARGLQRYRWLQMEMEALTEDYLMDFLKKQAARIIAKGNREESARAACVLLAQKYDRRMRLAIKRVQCCADIMRETREMFVEAEEKERHRPAQNDYASEGR